MQKTEHLDMFLPELYEQYNLEYWNSNTETIDENIARLDENMATEQATRAAGDLQARSYGADLENAVNVLAVEHGGTGVTTLDLLAGSMSEKIGELLSPLITSIARAMTPVGTVLSYFGVELPSEDWLWCDGSSFDADEYPLLYSVLGNSSVVPDTREAALVGAGERASGVAAHDVFTVGEFKDDQFQGHTFMSDGLVRYDYRYVYEKTLATSSSNGRTYRNNDPVGLPQERNYGTPRYGFVTRGKRLGCNFIIKAR